MHLFVYAAPQRGSAEEMKVAICDYCESVWPNTTHFISDILGKKLPQLKKGVRSAVRSLQLSTCCHQTVHIHIL